MNTPDSTPAPAAFYGMPYNPATFVRVPQWARAGEDAFHCAQGLLSMSVNAVSPEGHPRPLGEEGQRVLHTLAVRYGRCVAPAAGGDAALAQAGTLPLAARLAAGIVLHAAHDHPDAAHDDTLHHHITTVTELLWPDGPVEPAADSLRAGLALRRHCRTYGLDRSLPGVGDLVTAATATAEAPGSHYPAAQHHLVRTVAHRYRWQGLRHLPGAACASLTAASA
ncbi:hypothetical protein ABT112_27035 [Streptomyces sp. NPDC002055]|uniref:hypothetical protein n=1 Tax=Streptomyces sp. NPDC002055 TaxID=3154534 RepID=UPI003325A2A6